MDADIGKVQLALDAGAQLWPAGATATRVRAGGKRNRAVRESEGVVGRVTEGSIAADICKGIFVISHTPWFARPNLEVQILRDGGSIS